MKSLRMAHLYLGCIFAPMLLFFAISGLWQLTGIQWPQRGESANLLTYLSTIHTGASLKVSGLKTLSSVALKWFIAAMAMGFIATTSLGVVMAFRLGHARIASCCLAVGFAVPAILVALALLK